MRVDAAAAIDAIWWYELSVLWSMMPLVMADLSPDRQGAEPGLPEADVDLVQRSLRGLRWRDPFHVVRTLSAGASGARVFLLDLDGEHAVLKVTEDPDWRERADREFAVYDQLAEPLGRALPKVLAAHRDRGAVRLLLKAHQPLPPALSLDHASWLTLADQLG